MQRTCSSRSSRSSHSVEIGCRSSNTTQQGRSIQYESGISVREQVVRSYVGDEPRDGGALPRSLVRIRSDRVRRIRAPARDTHLGVGPLVSRSALLLVSRRPRRRLTGACQSEATRRTCAPLTGRWTPCSQSEAALRADSRASSTDLPSRRTASTNNSPALYDDRTIGPLAQYRKLSSSSTTRRYVSNSSGRIRPPTGGRNQTISGTSKGPVRTASENVVHCTSDATFLQPVQVLIDRTFIKRMQDRFLPQFVK